MSKKSVIEIRLQLREGHPDDTRRVHIVTSWSQANSLLSTLSNKVERRDESGLKLDFLVTFSDGSTYEGRLHVKHWSRGPTRVDAHVRESLLYLAGSKRPAHRTQSQYLADLASYPRAILDRAREFLRDYSLNAYELDELT